MNAVVQICAPASLLAVAIVLLLEAGLLIGIVLPAGSLVLGLGVLGGMGVLPLPLAALTAAIGTVLGAALGHQVVMRRSGGASSAGDGLGGRLPTRITRVVDRLTSLWREAVRRRPVRAAATAQFVVGARTLAPRLAASAGVPLATMLRGTAPASLLWSSGLVTTGAVAGAALPLIDDLLTVGGTALVLVLAACLLARRRVRSRAVRFTGSSASHQRCAGRDSPPSPSPPEVAVGSRGLADAGHPTSPLIA